MSAISGTNPVGIDALRGVSLGPSAEELIDAMDARTRRLLARAPRATRGWLVRRALAAADLIGLLVSYVLAQVVAGEPHTGAFGGQREQLLFAAALPLWLLVANLHGLYGRDQERADHSTTDDLTGVFHMVTLGTWWLLATSRLTGLANPAIYKLVAFWLLAVCVIPLARTAARAACQSHVAFQQNAVIVGAGEVGQLIARKLLKHPEYGINVVGFVDARPLARRADLPDQLTILGSTEHLAAIVDQLRVERVVLSFSNQSERDTLELIRRLQGLNVQIDLVPRLFELMGPRVTVHMVEGLPLIGLPPMRLTASRRLLKRAIDIAAASLGLLLCAPLFAYVALRITLDSQGPIFFRQVRLGAGRREFTALKFRTMKVGTSAAAHEEYIRRTMSVDGADGNVSDIYKLDQSDAVTCVGRWLRRTSLDELPQLINVLRGDMSLVGPRPCIPYETEHFQSYQLERFSVPQGITGLWQVTARANSTFGEALDMDVAYVRGWSLGLDLRLILRTPLAILRQRKATV